MYCMKNSPEMKTLYYVFRLRRHSKRYNLRILGLNRTRELLGKEGDYINDIIRKRKVEMEMKNMSLYMKNKRIMEENEKLREIAIVLHQENQALLSQLQHKLNSQPKSH